MEAPGPNDQRSQLVRDEVKRAGVWVGMVAGVALAWVLAQPLLLILAGLVFAAMLDGGTRLLGRALPIGRGWRLTIVILSSLAFLVWTVAFAGSQLTAQAAELQQTVIQQVNRGIAWANAHGAKNVSIDAEQITGYLAGSVGKVTAWVGSIFGVISNAAMIFVLGIFIAIDPHPYQRGLAWFMPMQTRDDFYKTVEEMAFTLRRLMAGRLLGMAVEGVGTWILLALYGVPMAGLLGILTGLLAFIPNIGAIISGALLILVGFSAGTDTGIYAIGVYLFVQIIDGYIIVPIVAKKSVDLAPALVLAAQMLFGALFGILGLALADPIVAMLKVFFEQGADRDARKAARKGWDVWRRKAAAIEAQAAAQSGNAPSN